VKTAVVAVTGRGAAVAVRVSAALAEIPGAEVDLILPAKFAGAYPGAQPYNRPLGELCGEWFGRYRALVMVMALGIVFRLLAPLVKDKRTDPAVVVMDEGGQFAVSALSGHLGGANDLARHLQRRLGCRAVITTATDVHGLPAVDLLARDFNLAMEPFEMVRAVNAAIVNGEPVHFYAEAGPAGPWPGKIKPLPLECYHPGRRAGGLHVFITNKIIAEAPDGSLFLRPRNLVVGLGCRRGVGAAAVKAAVAEALDRAGRSLSSVRLLATVDIRAGEDGLVRAAVEMKLSLVFFTREEIAGVFRLRGEELTFSQYVFDKIGVGGVCEPVALLAAPAAKLILKKKSLNGVTVAVAGEAWPWWEPDRGSSNS